VVREVLRGVAMLAASGVGVGVVCFAAASRVLESHAYGVSPTDPATLAAMSVTLVAAALAGAWLPTRRATRVDPVMSLRIE
jgi:ABC-type antimicrobial peptide transport system permease subunit